MMSGAAEDAGEPGSLQPLQHMCVEVGVDSDSVTLTTTDRAARERQAASQKKQTARLGNGCLLLTIATATATATFFAETGADGPRISIASHEVGDEVALRVAGGEFEKAFRRQTRCKNMELQLDVLWVAAALTHVADEHVLKIPESVELI